MGVVLLRHRHDELQMHIQTQLEQRLAGIHHRTRQRLAQLLNAPRPERVVFTQNATEAINLGIKGLVRPGFLADLLLVDGDPTEDVTIVQDKDRLAMIMKGGRLHKAPAETRLAETA